MTDRVKTRSYNSARRRLQAAATRREILDTARDLFERNGYASTTMPAVAKQAGVALKTVYTAFETKSGLLHAVWDLALGGDDNGVPVAERNWYREVLDDPDPARQLQLNARNSANGKQRIGAILEVIRGGAEVDAEVARLWDTIQTEYHDNQRRIVESLRAKKALKRGLRVAKATDLLWLLNHPSTWELLVGRRGWSAAQYEKYVADMSCAQLLR